MYRPRRPYSHLVFQRRGQVRPDGMDTAGRAAEKQTVFRGPVAIHRPPTNGVCQKTACSNLGCDVRLRWIVSMTSADGECMLARVQD